MKIVAGMYKGFRLNTFKGREIRPTPSKVREAVFDMLGSSVIESDFLDLFAGTGAIGIEAFSRGAKKVTFVEINQRAIGLIKENLLKIYHDDFSNIIKNDFHKALERLSEQQRKYDIIFLDPPYKKNYLLKALLDIDQSRIFKKKSIIMLQHHTDEKVQGDFDKLEFMKGKKYGKSAITVFRYQE
ncbi:MAG: 16S rRNA (guanine(966)-N(2))-methyltransferase RsmD [Atribacterota bacterium]